MYQTGSVAGIVGPTIFLLEGKNRCGTYIKKLLFTNGDAIESTIIMTPTAFMEKESWENYTPEIIVGLLNIYPIIKANLQ